MGEIDIVEGVLEGLLFPGLLVLVAKFHSVLLLALNLFFQLSFSLVTLQLMLLVLSTYRLHLHRKLLF